MVSAVLMGLIISDYVNLATRPLGQRSRVAPNSCAASPHVPVGVRTLHQWLTEDEAFQADYTAARQATFEGGMSRVQALTGKEIETLDELLGEKDHPECPPGCGPYRGGTQHPPARCGSHPAEAGRDGGTPTATPGGGKRCCDRYR